MQVVLVMFLADGARRSFPLPRAMTVIGRREDCDLRIPLTEVSRKHCRIIKDANELRLEDLGSSNGTYLNNKRVHETVMQPGDQIRVGPVIFTVQIDGSPSDSMIKPHVEEAEDIGSDSTIEADVPAAEPTRAVMAGRPLAPKGDDFSLSPKPQDDPDIVDIDSIISPSDDDDLIK